MVEFKRSLVILKLVDSQLTALELPSIYSALKEEDLPMRKRRKYLKTNLTRPRKKTGAKMRRQRDHRKRLIALGVSEETVARMNPLEVRTKLKYPSKVAQEVATASAE